MKCEDYLELLSPYLDNALSLEEQQKLEAHLKECSKCQEELDNLKWITSCLNTLEEAPLPEDFHGKLMSRVNETKTKKTNKNRLFAYASSLAAVAILAVVFISQDHTSIVPEAINTGEPEIASYSMQRSVVQEAPENIVGQSKQGRAMGNASQEESIVANDAENNLGRARAGVFVPTDTWHITCVDAAKVAQSIEEIAKTNGYQVQSIIQDTTISMTFEENIEREIIKNVIEEAEGIEEFITEEAQNDQLTLIIKQSTS